MRGIRRITVKTAISECASGQESEWENLKRAVFHGKSCIKAEFVGKLKRSDKVKRGKD
jgi:hypothetical protein